MSLFLLGIPRHSSALQRRTQFGVKSVAVQKLQDRLMAAWMCIKCGACPARRSHSRLQKAPARRTCCRSLAGETGQICRSCNSTSKSITSAHSLPRDPGIIGSGSSQHTI